MERFIIRLLPLFCRLARSNSPYFHIILYLKNPKESTEKLLHTVREFSCVVRYKINKEKNPINFFYTNSLKVMMENSMYNRKNK